MPSKKKMTKSEERHAALKWAVEGVTPELILAITCIVLGVAMTTIIFAGFGYKMGQKNADNEVAGANSSDVSIINIDYRVDAFAYNADEACVGGVSSERCLLENYGVKGSNYAVIRSGDQLNNLKTSVKNISGQELNYDVDSSFFNSSSIVAIVNEDGVAEYNLTNAYRDEKYGLHFQTKSIGEAGNSGHLLLIQVPNIQTKDVTVINSEV